MILFFLGILFSVTAVIYSCYKYWFQYWKYKGVKYAEPSIPFGSLDNPFMRTRNLAEILQDIYCNFRKQKLKDGGFYAMATPVYMPLDLDYIKNIMTKDFAHFTDRGMYYNEKDDPLTAHLFSIGGAKWRNLRVKLTPTFTTGKMKMMFPTLVACGEIFKKLMDTKTDGKQPIDIKEELGRFTTDIIGNCAFGLETKSIAKEESPFRKHGRALFNRSRLDMVKGIIAFNFQSFGRLLGIRILPKETADFFMNVVKDTVDYRERNNYTRNDFMQILVDLKNKKLDHEDTEEHDGKSLTIEEIAAQCFVFFIAGFETSSTTMTFSLLEMCLNLDIQDKVREEINTVLAKHNDQITYDAIMEMKYMNQVIDEALRLYPPVPTLMRKCVKQYKIPDSGVILDEGVRVFIPIYSIHRDPEYFPNPEKFDPERFTEEKKKNMHPYAFLPFGEGPRICIGLRFGLMQSKVGLTILLKNYRFTLHERTEIPIKMDPKNFIFATEKGVWLKAEKIST